MKINLAKILKQCNPPFMIFWPFSMKHKTFLVNGVEVKKMKVGWRIKAKNQLTFKKIALYLKDEFV